MFGFMYNPNTYLKDVFTDQSAQATLKIWCYILKRHNKPVARQGILMGAKMPGGCETFKCINAMVNFDLLGVENYPGALPLPVPRWLRACILGLLLHRFPFQNPDTQI